MHDSTCNIFRNVEPRRKHDPRAKKRSEAKRSFSPVSQHPARAGHFPLIPNTATMRFTLALTLAFAAGAAAHDVPSLTPENYDEITDGKTVFIKFFAPWVSSHEHLFLSRLSFSLRRRNPTRAYGEVRKFVARTTIMCP